MALCGPIGFAQGQSRDRLTIVTTALKFSISTDAPAPRVMLSVKEASQRMGVSERRIVQLAGSTWASQGLARLEKGAWLIADTADSRLSAVQFPDQMPFDPTGLTDEQRREVFERRKILCGWYEARKEGFKVGRSVEESTAIYLLGLEAKGRVVKPRTLYLWEDAYRQDGTAGLVDRRWMRQKPDTSKCGEFFNIFDGLWLTPRRLSIRVAHAATEVIAEERGIAICSYKQVQRHISTIPKAVIVRKREGEDAYVAKCEPYLERDYSSINSNDLWCGDHHRFDVMIVLPDGKYVRPWLTAWQDMRSRKIVGWSIFATDPNSDTILRAFVSGCKSHGVPAGVYIDNGKDYDSRALQGITKKQRRAGESADDRRVDGAFQILNVKCTHVWAYHGQSKPIERFFGTVCARFSKLWETYCGKDTQSKPENLQQQLEAGKAPTLQELSDAFADWLANDYHGRMHLGDSMNGQTPAQVFDQCLIEKRAISDEMLEFACLPRTREIKVGQHGVTWHGLSYGKYEPAMQRIVGERVVLAIDEKSINAVLVLTPGGKLICRAQLNKKLAVNVDKETLKAAVREKKQHKKTFAAYQAQRPRMAEDMHSLLNRAAQQKLAETTNDDQIPPPLKQVRTVFDEQQKHVAQAMRPAEMKQAVGAESLSTFSMADFMRERIAQVKSEFDREQQEDFFAILGKAMRSKGASHAE